MGTTFSRDKRSTAEVARAEHFDIAAAGARLPANLLSQFFEKDMGPVLGGGVPYTAASWTVTTGGTGDTQAQATTAGGGVLITLASDDDFDTTLDWACGNVVPASGLYVQMLCRYQQSHATQAGFKIGLTTGGAAAPLPFGTNYADCIVFSKAIASANILGQTRGSTGTAADSATLGTCVAATEIELGFYAYFHSSTPAGSWFVNGTETAFSAAQLTTLTADGTNGILNGPPTLKWTIHGTGTTGNNPTMTVTSLVACADAA